MGGGEELLTGGFLAPFGEVRSCSVRERKRVGMIVRSRKVGLSICNELSCI
jgi:hypothetical protein